MKKSARKSVPAPVNHRSSDGLWRWNGTAMAPKAAPKADSVKPAAAVVFRWSDDRGNSRVYGASAQD